MLAVPFEAQHHDPELYPDPETFDPWRFSRVRETDEKEIVKHQLVYADSDYVVFGVGKHAWFVLPEP